jgi:hypothetical protein
MDLLKEHVILFIGGRLRRIFLMSQLPVPVTSVITLPRMSNLSHVIVSDVTRYYAPLDKNQVGSNKKFLSTLFGDSFAVGQ